MKIISDFIHTLTRGALQEDRPLLLFVFGLLVLSVTLIVFGLAKEMG